METINYQYINKTYIRDIKKTNSQLKRYFNTIKQIVNYFTKFNKKDIKKTIQELEENLKYFIEKVQVYYQKLHQVILRKKG